MVFSSNRSMPPPVPAGTSRGQETARAQKVSQAQFVEERLRNGIPPVAVAGVATLLTQLETMQALPGMSFSITAEVAGYRRTLVCQNNAWDEYDLTHQFLDERCTAVYGPSLENDACQPDHIAIAILPNGIPSTTDAEANTDYTIIRWLSCLWNAPWSSANNHANNFRSANVKPRAFGCPLSLLCRIQTSLVEVQVSRQ